MTRRGRAGQIAALALLLAALGDCGQQDGRGGSRAAEPQGVRQTIALPPAWPALGFTYVQRKTARATRSVG